MFDPGGYWGMAVVAGTILLGLAFAYGMIVAPRRRQTPDGTPPNETSQHRWGVIASGALFVLGVMVILYWLFRATPGVAG